MRWKQKICLHKKNLGILNTKFLSEVFGTLFKFILLSLSVQLTLVHFRKYFLNVTSNKNLVGSSKYFSYQEPFFNSLQGWDEQLGILENFQKNFPLSVFQLKPILTSNVFQMIEGTPLDKGVFYQKGNILGQSTSDRHSSSTNQNNEFFYKKRVLIFNCK